MTGAVPNPLAPSASAAPAAVEPDGQRPVQPARAAWIVAVVATVAALVAGGLAIAGQVNAAEQSRTAAAAIEELEADVERLTDERDSAMAAYSEREEAIEELDAAARERSTELDEREAELRAREAAVTQEEAAAEAREFSDGVHVIGTSIEPGVYTTPGGGFCYYAWKSGTGSDAHIIDNNIVSGPATVTLDAGDVFESTRCGNWTKQD